MPLIRKPTGGEPARPGLNFEQARAGLRSALIEERWRAARALAAFPQAAAMLGEAAGVEPEPRVREAIFTSLARIGAADGLRALARHIRSDDAARRNGAWMP